MAAKSDNRVFSPLRAALLPRGRACATVGMNDRSPMTVHGGSEAETVAAGLASAASRHFGGPATIEGLRRESGGASRQTWSFDAVLAGPRHELILRRDPPAVGGREKASATSLDRSTEFAVLR